MHFYTNVQKYKDFILARGIKNGKKYIKRLQYEPTLYIPTKKHTATKSIRGEFLQAKKFGSINHARNWRKKFHNTNVDIHGLDSWEYTFINESFPSNIEFDIKKINILNIDIECEFESGFPEPVEA